MKKTKTIKKINIMQTFTRSKKCYELDSKTGKLEQIDSIDLQEMVNSSADCELSKLYEKFTTGEVVSINKYKDLLPSEKIIFDDTNDKDELNNLAELIKISDKYKKELKLSDNLSPDKVFEEVQRRSKDLNKEIKNKIDIMNAKKLLKKEQLEKKELKKIQKEKIKHEKEI